jgi:5-methylcytosine-specific restriction endonuclease McrA
MSWTSGRPAGKSFPDSTKSWALVAYKHRCYVCGAPGPGLEFDHIIPWAEGGTNERRNCAPICPPCHKVKTTREKDRARKRREAKAKRPAESHPSEGLKPS